MITSVFVGRCSETIDAINLLKLSPDNLRKAPTGLYIDILQQKTKKAETVGVVDSLVIEILENEFPNKVAQLAFNKQIKVICKIAGNDEVVRGFKKKSKGLLLIYEFVRAHIMRRSFASNYYGKIEIPLLMNITGHKKESTFLTYIGTHENKDALANLLMEKARVIWL